MLWVLKGTVSMKQFFRAPKSYVKNNELGNLNNFKLTFFDYLNYLNNNKAFTGFLKQAISTTLTIQKLGVDIEEHEIEETNIPT